MKLSELQVIFPDLRTIQVTMEDEKTFKCKVPNIMVLDEYNNQCPVEGEGQTTDECFARIAELLSNKIIIVNNGVKHQLPIVTFI